jgi:hypothetical protein
MDFIEGRQPMLTHDELVELYRSCRSTKVLSIYLDGGATDFAERKVWFRRLEHALDEIRPIPGDTRDEGRRAFLAAEALLRKELEAFPNFLPERGWVGFASVDKVLHCGASRVPMPDLVRWEPGLRVAPYVRALKQERLIVGVLVDSRRARLFTYQDGVLAEPENLHADGLTGDLSDTNQSRRATHHSGTRGETATDAAQKLLDREEQRMLKAVVATLQDRLGNRGRLVVGGTPEVVRHLMGLLPDTLRHRTISASGLRVEMTDAEVRKSVEEAASRLNQQIQEAAVAQVIDEARGGGRATLCADPVTRALREARVDTLFLSRGFIRANPEYADHMVGTAFEQHAEVEELAADGGHRLDAEAEGVAARLRYVL